MRGAGTGLAALIAIGLAPGVAVAAPSDAEVAQAQAERDAAAAQVGQLSAQLAAAEAAATRAGQDAQIALQDYEITQAALEEARAAQAAAQAALDQARAQLDQGRADVATFARSSYMQGSTAPGITALMTSGGPAELVERAALLEAAGTHRVDVVGQLTVLEQQATAAEVETTASAAQAEELEAQAADQLASAQAQEIAAREQMAAVATQRAEVEEQLAAAEAEFGELSAQQEAAEQQAAQQLAAQQAAQQQAAQQQAANRPAPSAPSPGTAAPAPQSPRPQPVSPAPAPRPVTTPAPIQTTVGAPSASAAQRAIDAATSQIGVRYSWGGGGKNGPSNGITPDTGVYGFDCSGLMEYAYWQAGISVGGVSRDQYWINRGRTVARADLMPGDLVFWASNPGDYRTIYHVALYLGGGRVVHAPDRGDVVKVESMWYGSQYFGAVRPTG